MLEETEKNLLKKMQRTSEEIKMLLEDIKAVLLLTNQDKLEDAKKNLLKEGTVEKQVYDLCDGVSAKEIADKIGKSLKYVHAVISTLRRKGLVRTVEREKKIVYEQRF